MSFPFRARARGRMVRREAGVMNRYEKEHSLLLDSRISTGLVQWYVFDAIKLRLAASTFYTPDFLVMMPDGQLEIHEVKGGFIEDDAIIKIKVAAEKFPFKFILCQKKRANQPWIYTEFNEVKSWEGPE